MTKKDSRKSLLWYWVAFVISLLIIFLVGTKVVPWTWESNMILTPSGITQFKRWLDLAGWVRLTYKIDFSKYESVYANDAAQLLSVKKTAQDIILKNIDKRISTLGVSDYNAYVQKLSDGEYIVVEIWWIQDLSAAKKLIGKTVELEFKIPNEVKEEDVTTMRERQKLAEEIFATTVKNPESMQDTAASKGSADAYYDSYVDASFEELPLIYQNNIEKLSSIQSGTVYPTLLSGVYHVLVDQEAIAAGTGDATQILKWFTTVYFRGKKDVVTTQLTEGNFLSYADRKDLAVSRSSVSSYTGKTQSINYDAAKKALVYVADQILPGQAWYDVSIYQVKAGDDVAKFVSEIENGDRKANLAVISGRQNTWIITNFVPSFVYDAAKKVQSFKELDATYVVAVRGVKNANDTLFPILSIPAATEQIAKEYTTALTNKTLYSFDDIFVSDTLRRLPAKDPKSDDILNGAYFKYAQVGTSQAGKPTVSILFDDKGKEIFCNLTEQLVGKQMAIFVGGKLMTAPVIRDKICGWSAEIDGSFDIKGARTLADDLNSGALPAPLLLSHEETIAPSLGQNALHAALLAWLFGILIVYFVLMALYGFKKANIALIGIITFLVFLLTIIKVLWIVSSLSSIAAIILSLGMAVDSNVLMYERIREEQKAWKWIASAIEDGYERSWAPIRDGNITTGIIWALLFLVGVNVFKWFGTMMLINMILILFVITPLTRHLLRRFYNTK